MFDKSINLNSRIAISYWPISTRVKLIIMSFRRTSIGKLLYQRVPPRYIPLDIHTSHNVK